MDLDTLFHMSYDEYVKNLLEKYGAVPGDYFIDEFFRRRNPHISRSKEGLLIHHIDEDKIAGLSDMNINKMKAGVTSAYHKADRLVYCHYVEHMILHMKIIEKELTKTANEREWHKPLGICGFVNIATSINDFFTGARMSDSRLQFDISIAYWKSFSGSWTTLFVQAIKYFVEKIETREDFQKWYGVRENFTSWYEPKDSLADYLIIVHQIYNSNPIEFNETINMENYNGIYDD